MIDNDIFNQPEQSEHNETPEESDIIILPEGIEQIPVPIKQRALLMPVLALAFIAIILVGHLIMPEFYYVKLLIACLIFGLYTVMVAYSIISKTLREGYICLKGTIVNIYTEKFDKKSYIIQMYDEQQDIYLSFKYGSANSIDVGIPISLYLNPNEKISSNPDFGNMIESYLAVVFTKDELTANHKKTVSSLTKTE